jgi:anaerobic selenocysteine-containing dehydrogenase
VRTASGLLTSKPEKGTKLVVIDPQLTKSAQEADIRVRLKPCTDGALALEMLNVIINEALYDNEFAEKWCLGFYEVRTLVQKYSINKVENICWIPGKQIVEVAKLLATSEPAYISRGVCLSVTLAMVLFFQQ